MILTSQAVHLVSCSQTTLSAPFLYDDVIFPQQNDVHRMKKARSECSGLLQTTVHC